jgi:two-component system sensor histidine kinase ChvG
LPIARTDEQRSRLLAVIQHDVRRLDRLITDISDASRLDAELAREATEPVDVARLMETVVAIARETRVGDRRQIQLTLEPGRRGRNAFFLLGHDSRLGQVFNNLIDNALSFSPPDGQIRIHARREAARLVVTVDDDGPGIRAESFESIFERFYTDRPGVDEFGQNSGLGLAITRQIVEAHRGTIEATNRRASDGGVEGARFTVILPAPH